MREGKLVRDKIPQLALDAGEHRSFITLTPDEFREAAARKLVEEAKEACEAVLTQTNRYRLLEELADVRAIECALMRSFGITERQLEEARKRKAREKGEFWMNKFETTSKARP